MSQSKLKEPAEAVDPPISRRRLDRYRRSRVLQRLLRNRGALVAAIVLLALTLVALFHSVLEPDNPLTQDLANRLKGPSRGHLLGTDQLGRDVLSRLIFSTGNTLSGAALGTLFAFAGAPLGFIAGYFRSVADTSLTLLADGLQSIPPLLFAFGIIGFLGPGQFNAALAIGIALSPRFFRVARTAAVTISSELYIEAARASGCSTRRILIRHVLPNTSGPMLVLISQALGFVISIQAGLSLLGLGPTPPASSWGSMLRDVFASSSDAIWSLLPASISIVIVVLCFFAIGDAIRDAFSRNQGGRP